MGNNEYLKQLYNLIGYDKNFNKFYKCMNANGKEIADKLAASNVYDHLNILIENGSRKIPRQSLLNELYELFEKINVNPSDIDEICASYKHVIYEKDILYTYMWMLENNMIEKPGLNTYESLLYKLGCKYTPSTYESMGRVIQYIVLSLNCKCDVFCRLIDEWEKIKEKYSAKLEIQFSSEEEMTYNTLKDNVLKNGFMQDRQITLKSVGSIESKVKDVVENPQILSQLEEVKETNDEVDDGVDDENNCVVKILGKDIIMMILDTERRRQWYFLRIIQQTIECQIKAFVKMYEEVDGKKNINNKKTMSDALKIIFLDIHASQVNSILGNTQIDSDELSEQLKNCNISISKIYRAFNTVFDSRAFSSDTSLKYSDEEIQRILKIPPQSRDEYDKTIIDDYHHLQYENRCGFVPYLFAQKIFRQERHIVNGVYQKEVAESEEENELYEYYDSVTDDVMDYLDAVIERRNHNAALENKIDHTNPYNEYKNGNNRKKMITDFFMKEKAVSREMLWLTVVLSKVYGGKWTINDVTDRVMFNSRCSRKLYANSRFDRFCKDVFECKKLNVKERDILNKESLDEVKNSVSKLSWQMEEEYLRLDGTAQSIEDLDEGIAVFYEILQGRDIN